MADRLQVINFKYLEDGDIFYYKNVKYIKKYLFHGSKVDKSGDFIYYNTICLENGEFSSFSGYASVLVEVKKLKFRDINVLQGFYIEKELTNARLLSSKDREVKPDLYVKLRGYVGSSNTVNVHTAVPFRLDDNTYVVIDGLPMMKFTSVTKE